MLQGQIVCILQVGQSFCVAGDGNCVHREENWGQNTALGKPAFQNHLAGLYTVCHHMLRPVT